MAFDGIIDIIISLYLQSLVQYRKRSQERIKLMKTMEFPKGKTCWQDKPRVIQLKSLALWVVYLFFEIITYVTGAIRKPLPLFICLFVNMVVLNFMKGCFANHDIWLKLTRYTCI